MKGAQLLGGLLAVSFRMLRAWLTFWVDLI
jgi:hypothetical protein